MYALQSCPGFISEMRNGRPVAGLLAKFGWIGGNGSVMKPPRIDSSGRNTSHDRTPPANIVPAILGPMT
jgi:hypothetical protein